MYKITNLYSIMREKDKQITMEYYEIEDPLNKFKITTIKELDYEIPKKFMIDNVIDIEDVKEFLGDDTKGEKLWKK